MRAASAATCVGGCVGVHRKTEERRKKNSRKTSGASARQKGTELISEALTNYFLRRGVSVTFNFPPTRPSVRRPPPLFIYLFTSEGGKSSSTSVVR